MFLLFRACFVLVEDWNKTRKLNEYEPPDRFSTTFYEIFDMVPISISNNHPKLKCELAVRNDKRVSKKAESF